MQKYGLLYANTCNLGDDIQALAAKQFLPQVDCYIERDSIQDFSNIKENNIKTIINGWWAHNCKSWPPPLNIKPLITSVHIHQDIKKSFLTNHSKKYCVNKEFGARDKHTYDFLIKNGFKNAYISYCLTLTFPEYSGDRNNNVLFVDADGYKNNQELTHYMPKLFNMPVEQRLEIAKQRLEIYKKAKLVVTSRLHCALPCIAFGTPVVFIKPNLWPSRISGYEKILSYQENTKQIKEKLINKCKKFVEN